MASSHRSGKFRRLLSTTSGYASPASSGSSLLLSAPSPPSVQPDVCASVGHAVCSAASSTSLSASATISSAADPIGSTSGGTTFSSCTASSGSSLLLPASPPPSAKPSVGASVGHGVCSAAGSTSPSAVATISLVWDSIGSTS